MEAMSPFNFCELVERIPPGNGFRYDMPISPFSFRDTSGLSLTGSGNQQIAVTSGRPAVLLSASAAGAVLLAHPLPGFYDPTKPAVSGLEKAVDGDCFELRLLISCSTAGPRNLTGSLKNTRLGSLTAWSNPADVVKAINATAVTEYVWSWTGSGLFDRDVPAVTLTAENAAGNISIWGGQLTIKSNLAMYDRLNR